MSLGRARWVVPLFIFLNVWGLTTRGKISVSGDEPHYLMIAESLLVDRDLDLENNYAEGHGVRFGAPNLRDQGHGRRTASGALMPVHDIGLPLLVLPAYAATSRLAQYAPETTLERFRMSRGSFGAALLGLLMAACVAWSLSLLQAGLARVTSTRVAIGTTLVFGLTPPVFSFAFLLFPETVALIVTCAVVWLTCQGDDELTRGRISVVAVAVALTPWLHRKFSLLAIGLLAVIVLRHRFWIARQARAWQIATAGACLVAFASLHVWTLAVWGQIGGPQMAERAPFSLAGLHTGALGLLFDREYGLFSYAPVYLLVPAAFLLSWQASRWWLLPLALLYLPMASYDVWFAGFSPTPRYLVPLMPIFALAVARAWRHRSMRLAAIPLLLFQAAIWLAIWSHPRVLWPKDLGTNQALAKVPVLGPAYERALPSITTGDSLGAGWVWVLALAVLTTAISFSSLERRAREKRP